ncbi:MAG: energy transducer TonB [Pseudomonadota bacterium]
MTTLTFDSIGTSPRRPAIRHTRKPAAARAPVIKLAPATAPPSKPGNKLALLALLAGIGGLHAAAVVAFSGGTTGPTVAPRPAPIEIALAAPQVKPPPPPPPPPQIKPPPQAPRLVKAVPVAPSTPVVADDTPLGEAGADSVQVATASQAAAPVAPPAPPAPAPEPVTAPRGYAGYLSNPAPDYPAAAQRRGLEGRVVLKVRVLASGQPASVEVDKSSGHTILDDAALKAVARWVFAPARRGQLAIDGWVQIPLNFKI